MGAEEAMIGKGEPLLKFGVEVAEQEGGAFGFVLAKVMKEGGVERVFVWSGVWGSGGVATEEGNGGVGKEFEANEAGVDGLDVFYVLFVMVGDHEGNTGMIARGFVAGEIPGV